MTVTLLGPDGRRSNETISDNATVRDVATSKYHLFWRTLKKNGSTVPLTAHVRDGDLVTVSNEPAHDE